MNEPMPFDPDAMMNNDYEPPVKPQQGGVANREAQPLNQDDAIILKDTKEEFERTPVPPAIYDAVTDQTNYGFDDKGKPKINVVLRITGPTQVGRLQFMNLAPRSNDFSAIRLKQYLARAQRIDAKGQQRSLIEFVDVNVKFDEKKFCDSGIAIGAECRINVALGKPYRDKATGETRVGNNIKDILLPSSGEKFM